MDEESTFSPSFSFGERVNLAPPDFGRADSNGKNAVIPIDDLARSGRNP
jgi:hypothetical protein